MVECGSGLARIGQESMFFFEKKNQKTFIHKKVFCFFFSEKKTFSCLS